MKRRTYSGWTEREREKQTGEGDRQEDRKGKNETNSRVRVIWLMGKWHWRRARLVDGRWGRAAGVKHSPQYPVDPGVIHARNSAI